LRRNRPASRIRFTVRAPEAGPQRLASIDLLRGLAMVVMALDHARDFFGTSGWDPTFAASGAATFVTRWITHFCAPVFVFLAGTSAALALSQGKPKAELSRFLLSRGAWLAALDLVVVSYVWFFRFGKPFVTDVLWAIGWSMIVLALLVRLPAWVATWFGLVLVAAHNALDAVRGDSLGWASGLWKVLHESTVVHLPFGADWFVGYPLIPWLGVMALGYALGSLMTGRAVSRRRDLALLGAATTGAFIALRAINGYGDPAPWTAGANALQTAFSFVSCHKYPPSLLFLLMTLGPALLALAALDGARPRPGNPLLVFGRVPLFFYVLHLFVLHLAAGLTFLPRLGAAAFHVDPDAPPAGFGLSLPGVYRVWAVAVVSLYWPCRWFGGVKRRRPGGWISYL
jgi:uncharacterized membrane protein